VIDSLKTRWADLKARYQQLLSDYGYGAVGVWFGIFLLTFGSFYVGIQTGMEVDGAVASAGTVGGAYLMTQATKPVRLVATLVLTPIVVGTYRRLRGLPAVAPAVVAEPVEAVEKA
jgi:hypothetical protein